MWGVTQIMIKKGYFYFLIFGMIIGGMGGILAINTLLSYRIDSYIQEITDLKISIEEKNEQVEKLNETLNSRKYIVKDVEIHLECKEKHIDELLKKDLQKKIKDSVKNVIGKEVRKIDVEMLWVVLEGRVIRIGDFSYTLKIKKLLVSETVMIWVEIK